MAKQFRDTIDSIDALLKTEEDSAIADIHSALDEAYKQVERKVKKRIAQLKSQQGDIPAQAFTELIQAKELTATLSYLNPELKATLQKRVNALIKEAKNNGLALADATFDFVGEDLSLGKVPVEQVAAASKQTFDALKRHGDDFARDTSILVAAGIARGASTRSIVADMRKQLGISKGRATNIVRTQSNQASNAAAEVRYGDAEIEFVQIFAIADGRLCPYCAARNYQIYKLGDIHLPLHPQCRCSLAPYDPEWEAEGLLDREFFDADRKEALDVLEQQGQKPNFGISPSEKFRGVEEVPQSIPAQDLLANIGAKPKEEPKPTAKKKKSAAKKKKKVAAAEEPVVPVQKVVPKTPDSGTIGEFDFPILEDIGLETPISDINFSVAEEIVKEVAKKPFVETKKAKSKKKTKKQLEAELELEEELGAIDEDTGESVLPRWADPFVPLETRIEEAGFGRRREIPPEITTEDEKSDFSHLADDLTDKDLQTVLKLRREYFLDKRASKGPPRDVNQVGGNPRYKIPDLSKSEVKELKRFYKEFGNFSTKNDFPFGPPPALVEWQALEEYTGTSYKLINNGIREISSTRTPKQLDDLYDRAASSSDDPDLLLKGLSRAAERALDAIRKHRGTTFRGANWNFLDPDEWEDMLKQFAPGTTFQESGFYSTSVDRDTARGFGAVAGNAPRSIVVVINGQNGAYIDPVSTTMGEEEVLFKPRSQFKVLASERGPNSELVVYLEDINS